MSVTELQHRSLSYRKDEQGKKIWYGRRVFSCAPASAATEILALDGVVMPDCSALGDAAPKCSSARGVDHPQGIKGLMLIIADYETPRVVGKARLWSRASGRMERRLVEPGGGSVIEGSDGTGVEWVVTKGDNRVPAGEAVLTLETAYVKSTYNSATLKAIEGTSNSAAVTLLGFKACPIDTLMCEAVNELGVYGDALIYVNFVIRQLCNGRTWGNYVTSTPGVWKPTTTVAVGEDGTTLTENRTGMKFHLGYTLDAGGELDATAGSARRLVAASADWTTLLGALASW